MGLPNPVIDPARGHEGEGKQYSSSIWPHKPRPLAPGKPKGYWKIGPGVQTLAAFVAGELTLKEAAELEGVSTGAIQQARLDKYGNKRLGIGRRTSERRLKRPHLEQLTTDFMKYAEDFASAVIMETQRDLVRQVAEHERTIEKQRDDLKRADDAIATLRAAIKSAESTRTRDILKKAGVISSE